MIKSAPYYWIECDKCGARCEYEGTFSAMANQSDAIDLAVDADWTTDGHRHHCTACPVLLDERRAET